MDILAIESSCDETAAAVVRDGREVVSSVINSQVAEHAAYGGVVPEIASRRHVENIVLVVNEALAAAKKTIGEIDAIAVTAAPGLIGALLVGVNFAKGLSLAENKPLIPVHHIRGHMAANYIAHRELKPPYTALVVSGGHSHIVRALDYTKMRVLGRTRDDAAGEAFDKAARAMGLPYPGGVSIDKLSGESKSGGFRLPTPAVSGSDLDFSFSGLKTAVINLIHNAEQKGECLDIGGLAFDFNEKIAEILCLHTERALRETGDKLLSLSGGVSANRVLRLRLNELCQRLSVTLYMPPIELCGDNAAMIGAQGYYQYKSGLTAGLSLNGSATMELGDEF